MTRPSALFCVAIALVGWSSWALPSFGQEADVRYFGVWSYTVNAPREELTKAAIEERALGYWELQFDGKDGVTVGTYRGKGGARWLSLEYVEADGRIYADLFAADGSFVKRKSTPLSSREPRWSNGAAP